MSNILRDIGSNLAKLRSLVQESKKDLQRIRTLRDALESSLDGIWQDAGLVDVIASAPQAREFSSLVTSARITSVAAQADEALGQGTQLQDRSWLGDGRRYARWLGDGISTLLLDHSSGGERILDKPLADLTARSLTLGYTDELVERLLVSCLIRNDSKSSSLTSLFGRLAAHDQRRFFLSTLQFLSGKILPPNAGESDLDTNQILENPSVKNSAGLLRTFVDVQEEQVGSILLQWLAKTPIASIGLYKAVILALPSEQQDQVLAQVWQQFVDKLYIRHAPIVQQEAAMRIILLGAGLIHKREPMQVFMHAHSSMHTTGVSDRLASSSRRARILGMYVGTLISKLADSEEARMTFEFDEEEQKELTQLEGLLNTNNDIGNPQALATTIDAESIHLPVMRKKPKPPPKSERTVVHRPKIVVVEEENEDDEFKPYPKPDSDAEDESEDPTLIRRDKLKPPVYIRDLVTGLQEAEDYDKHFMALQTAPNLIRRKADFGSELKDRATELASIYMGLHDPFNIEGFHELRLEGMVALLVAQPRLMGPYFASSYFTGDYALGQRVTVLTALGLSARELVGASKDQEDAKASFPSKTLPDKLHKMYIESTELEDISKRLEATMSRRTPAKRRARTIKSDMSRTVAECFFFPLTGRWQGSGQRSSLSPLLLPTYIKTLAIMLTSVGSSVLLLPQMTSELWDLLLSVRTAALKDTATLESVLFGFLTILSVNEDKRQIAQNHSKELLETQSWVDMAFERISPSDTEGERCRNLAAGVLVAIKEVVDSFRGLLLGDVIIDR